MSTIYEGYFILDAGYEFGPTLFRWTLEGKPDESLISCFRRLSSVDDYWTETSFWICPECEEFIELIRERYPQQFKGIETYDYSEDVYLELKQPFFEVVDFEMLNERLGRIIINKFEGTDVRYTERELFDNFQKEYKVTLVEILKWWILEKQVSKNDLYRAVELSLSEVKQDEE